MLDAKQIMAIIPHRQPILMVDRILEVEPGKRVVGLKNISANDPIFQGHFPNFPIFPGVLIVEALAQAGAVALMSMPEFADKLPVFLGIDECKFKKPTLPGDQLRLEVEITGMKRGLGIGQGKAFVGDELRCEAIIKFAMVDA
ncbi:MAG TPA: 3-hydroxyacyl-ACP dehydratase FabZ, partial [Symbiobacteriaceae bacterium]|nr:3-hydroxyacyl-ACP dehydratase FabZ [Symbiobacteriaceae bacterium]